MKSDIFKLDGSAPLTEHALDKVEMLAAYFGFDEKDVAFSRLLAEEAINAFASLLGINTGLLWVETTDRDFEVHLKTSAQLSTDKREELIDLSKAKRIRLRKGSSEKFPDWSTMSPQTWLSERTRSYSAIWRMKCSHILR
ncbi:MAG TPA: hypothetical protein PKZ34_00265 [Thermotogota bacterium]|nr:hypothetical protein [Thermotogota bacterium]